MTKALNALDRLWPFIYFLQFNAQYKIAQQCSCQREVTDMRSFTADQLSTYVHVFHDIKLKMWLSPYLSFEASFIGQSTYSVKLHLSTACQPLDLNYMCPEKHHRNIPKPNISELICDAGISPAGTFYCCEYFTLFSVVIYLAFRWRSCVGVTKQMQVLSCPVLLLRGTT